MKTWHFEHLTIAAILALVVVVTGSAWSEWIGAAAVLTAFGHASVAERLAERQAALDTPDVECHSKARWYWVAKEILWCAYFLVHRSYSAIVGCAVFLAYPLWRTFWRRTHPLRRTGA
jgi:hypothetical protein